jgi:hypothetical protein
MTASTGSPSEWLAVDLPRHQARYEVGDAPSNGSWRSIEDLLRDDAALLAATRDQLIEAGFPDKAAVTFLSSWFGGALGDAIGFALASRGAGFLPRADSVAWRVTDGGWPDRVRFVPHAVLVAIDHEWVGRAGVATVDDVTTPTVRWLIELVRPIVGACHRLARVGMVGLWNEVVDRLALCVDNLDAAAVDCRVVEALERAVRVTPAPWRGRPQLRIVDHPVLGDVYVGQKGGCCLAYTAASPDPQYCATCSLLDASECAARQMAMLEGPSGVLR